MKGSEASSSQPPRPPRQGGQPAESLSGTRLLASGLEPDGRLRVCFDIAAGSALFAGHFPDRPVLPGIAHLSLVTQALARQPGRAAAALPGGTAPAGTAELAFDAVEVLRLRLPVGPGDVLDLLIAGPGADGVVHFETIRDGAPVARGSGHMALAAELTAAPAPRPGTVQARPESALPSPRSLAALPHAPPALMARRILERGPRRAVCLCAVPSAHPLASQGEAPGYLALEAAAQTAALLRELADDRAADSAGGSSPPAALRPGYLVGVRQASFGLVLPVESALVASVVLEASMPPLNIYRFGVEWSGHERASGSISIYSD